MKTAKATVCAAVRRKMLGALALALVALFAGRSAQGATTTVASFKSASQLDLTGNFLAAVDCGAAVGPSVTIGGVPFTGNGIGGLYHSFSAAPLMNYPTTEVDLSSLMYSASWFSGAAPTTITVANSLVVGNPYKLQLLMTVGAGPDMGNVQQEIVLLDGATSYQATPLTWNLVNAMLPGDPGWGGFVAANRHAVNGIVVTFDYVATDPTLSVRLTGVGDPYYTLVSAFTLEGFVPEPASLALLGLGGLALLKRQHKP